VGRDGKARKVIMFRLNRVIEVEKENSHVTDSEEAKNDYAREYIFANEESRSVVESELFSNDPNLLDRALQIHSLTQNIVAKWVIEGSLIPLSPNSLSCDFDIAWESDFGRIVCEVKSLTVENEVHQFRFGLGQVLEYAHKIGASPVLMFSRRPMQSALIDAANRAGVAVLWPEILMNYSPRDLRILRAN
jgi:hypothetical protein